MTKTINTHIFFNENCEYQSSTTNIAINIEPQPVNIDITIINKSKIENIADNRYYNTNYYDDIIEVHAHVFQQLEDNSQRDIQTGRIIFYYRPINSNKKILLNDDKNSCILAQTGVAVLRFKPNKSGTIIAQYIDDKEWYENTEAHTEIILAPIPVTINFTKKPPYLSDLEDSVELEVEVKRKYTEEPINYGVVTFLHYIEHFDMDQTNKRIEHVIGNPVLVVDGKAKIKYIPIQEYSDLEPTDLIDKTEYIRAIYNYNNDLYFSEENETYSYETMQPNISIQQWKYFGSANVYTNIAIFKPNSVLIGIKNKSINDEGKYQYSEDSDIQITAKLFDNNGDVIILPEDSYKNLTFHIKGTYVTLSGNEFINEKNASNNFIYNDYSKDETFDTYEYEYDEDNNLRDAYFIKTISNLKPGNYTIQASTHGQIIDGETLLYDSNELLTITEEEVNDEVHDKYNTDEIRTDIYLDSIDISNTLYINSTFKEIRYNIVTQCTQSVLKKQETLNNYISSEITIDNTYKEILNNQRCYFFSPKTKTTYIGTLTYTNGKLIGKPTLDEIKFNSGNYPLYMYIPSGYYTNGDTNIYISYAPSPSIMLYVRSDITLILNYSLLSNTSLGNIKYNISSNDIYEDESTDVNVTLTKGSDIIDTRSFILTSYMNNWSNIIDNLNAGDYTLTASCSNYTTTQDFTILRGTLTQELQPNSKIIRATPSGVINLSISSSSADLTNLDLNKLHIYMCNNVDVFDINNATEHNYSVNYINQKSIYLTIDAGTYVPTKLLVAAYYEGDSNVIETLCEAEECNTTLISPNIKPLNYTNAIASYIIEPTVKNILVIGRVKYYEDNTVLEERLFITSNTLDIYLQNIPETCNNIQFIIDPYDNEIIQCIMDGRIPSNTERTLHIFGEQFLGPTDIKRAINYIKQQYIDSSNHCLFPLFEQQTQKFSRNIR